MSQIDTLDEQILGALQANGRLTMKALAEQVGMSSPAMIERVRRLEERGVIDGYRAVIAPMALGRPLTALISAAVDRADYANFLNQVENDPAVAECHRTTGEATFLVKVHIADTAALERLVDELGATGARCQTSLVLSSPIPYRALTPPEGVTTPRTRLGRRRRAAATGNGVAASPPRTAAKRPGRPRGRRVADDRGA